MGITILITSVLCGAILYGSLFVSSKLITKRASTSNSSSELKDILSTIEGIDETLSSALSYSENLIPLSNYTDLIKKKESFEDDLSNERVKLELLETKLKEVQAKVTAEEQNHASLKKGREEAIDLANAIKERKAQLESEQKRLNDELTNSMTQLDVLSNELTLTPEQEAGLNKIKSGIKSSQDQLASLSQTYKQASGRFATLHTQYSDLEKEFTKLVEKDLAGEEED